MGRRSQHTPEELRELILGATRRVVEEEGICQPSAREIARAIGYAPGTLYNMFVNLDEILLHVEARIFSELDQSLDTATADRKGTDAIRKFSSAYVAFACENPRIWQLIIQHFIDKDSKPPEWFLEKAYAPLNRLEALISRTWPNLSDDETSRRARLIWTALHGTIQLCMTSKFGPTSEATIASMAQGLTDSILASVTSTASQSRAEAAE